MSMRRETIYVSTEILRSLIILAKAQSGYQEEGGTRNITTADDIAEKLLREAIKEKYPDLIIHLREVGKLQDELIKRLGAKP